MLEPKNHGLLRNHQREKLINVMVYFAQNTQKCGKVKLFKLMYFLDFEHYKQIGRSVTGLNYYAWPMGPVPVDLYAEFDNSYFSKRELRLMEQLASQYYETSAEEMIEASHLEHKPYEYALTPKEKEVISELSQEHQEMLSNFL